jgi:hypothetical protein
MSPHCNKGDVPADTSVSSGGDDIEFGTKIRECDLLPPFCDHQYSRKDTLPTCSRALLPKVLTVTQLPDFPVPTSRQSCAYRSMISASSIPRPQRLEEAFRILSAEQELVKGHRRHADNARLIDDEQQRITTPARAEPAGAGSRRSS